MKLIKKYLQYRKQRKQQKLIEKQLLIERALRDVNNHINRIENQNQN